MSKLSGLLVTVAMLLSWGCASTFETRTFDNGTWKAGADAVEGVIYYEPRSVAITYVFTAAVDKDGNFLTSDCERIVQKTEITTIPDYSRPRVVINRPSPFAISKFGVTLNNGMLTGVNSESSPQFPQILQTIEQGLKDKVFSMTADTPARKACNASPVIRGITPVVIGN